MSINFNSNDSVGDIVAKFPGASDIFYKYNIDFCCGGNRPLKDAVSDSDQSVDKVLEEINAKFEEFVAQNNKFTDWTKESPSKLIDYIVNTHHAYLYEELPKTSQYILKILRVHGSNHNELFKVHELFSRLKSELEEHLTKEEVVLFPLIKKYEKNKDEIDKAEIKRVIEETEQEHTGAGDILKELREVTDHYSIPCDACTTYELTYNKIKEIESDLFQHIHLENNILFKNL